MQGAKKKGTVFSSLFLIFSKIIRKSSDVRKNDECCNLRKERRHKMNFGEN